MKSLLGSRLFLRAVTAKTANLVWVSTHVMAWGNKARKACPGVSFSFSTHISLFTSSANSIQTWVYISVGVVCCLLLCVTSLGLLLACCICLSSFCFLV